MKASEILQDARDRVANGWCQGRCRDQFGGVCAAIAVREAERHAAVMGTNQHHLSVYTALTQQLGEFGYYDSIFQFNDHPATTKQDVLNLFDKAILSLQEKGL